MSDRIAVMSHGRIEQVGTPAEIYEHPVNEFVAGFVGTSNVIERDGRRYTIRPEKLHVLAADAAVPDGLTGEHGTISEVVYLGAVTRYLVALERGGTLTALRQNLETSAMEALAQRGRRVMVAWRREHLAAVDAGTETQTGEHSDE